jgi:hypothetical protein
MIKNIKLPFYLIALLLIMTGCLPVPKDLCQIDQSVLNARVVQTRLFYTGNETELLTSGVSVLQDLGFHIDETEADLGMVRGSKETDATDNAQIAFAIAAVLITGQQVAVDANQVISVSFITFPSKTTTGNYYARIIFQQLITNTDNMTSKAIVIVDDEIYQDFFTKLSKAVFLEANKI